MFLVTTKKLNSDLESPHFLRDVANSKSGREMVMENEKKNGKVIEK